MNTLDKSYLDLLNDILTNGVEKSDRTGTGTVSIFGRQFRHKMSEGFPLLTTKKMAIKSIMTELKWFLKGNTNIKYLVDNGCNIWNGDAYKNYIEDWKSRKNNEWHLTQEEFINKLKTDDAFDKEWGDLGPIYGKQWREWYTSTLIKTTLKDPLTRNDTYVQGDKWIDQIKNLINNLKSNPDSRRLMVSAWNVGELDQMVLPPCHYGFQVYTRELSLEERMEYYYSNILKNKDLEEKARTHTDEQKIQYLQVAGVGNNIPTRAISLMWNQRSCDVPLGLPFNIASYAMLLELLAKEVNMVAEDLIGNLGDCHIYRNQVEGSIEQISRKPKPHLPKLKLGKVDVLNGEFDYEILNYKSHPTIKFPLSN